LVVGVVGCENKNIIKKIIKIIIKVHARGRVEERKGN